MKGVKCMWIMAMLCLALTVPVLSSAATQAPAAQPQAKQALTNQDCVKCHAGPPTDIAAAGGKHKNVGCNECHTGHRPASKNNIPQCTQCHDGSPHYKLSGCLGCHKNPHRPLEIQFGSKVTDPCLTCHSEQIKQLKQYPSKHTTLFCSTCHNVHGKIPPCTQCHKPHSPQMTQAECKKCHKAHMPKTVTYGSDVANKDCGSCHKKALDLLAASATKHKAVSCVSCHKEKHKMVPACQSCHGTPHPASMLSRFPKCGDCHNIAHDLNHWQAPAPGAAAPAGAKKKK